MVLQKGCPKPAQTIGFSHGKFWQFGVVPGPGAFQCSSSQGGSPSLDQGPMVMAGVAQHPWIVSDDPYGILRYYIHTYTYTYWVWVNTYRYIFSGMNIHLPAILMFTRGTRFWHTAICFMWPDVFERSECGIFSKVYMYLSLLISV